MEKTCQVCKNKFEATAEWATFCKPCYAKKKEAEKGEVATPFKAKTDKSDIILWSVCLKAASTVAAGNKCTPKALYDYTTALYNLKKNEGELVQ